MLSPEIIDQLLAHANQARDLSYSPYSNYPVGSSVLTTDGTYFAGCNVENSSFPAGICAEQVAVTKALSEGYSDFVAMAVVSVNGGTSCGVCRQVMAEHFDDIPVVFANTKGEHQILLMSELLPHAFKLTKNS